MGELICFLIGNGFNYMVRDIIENEELKEETKNIISLWEKFDKYFKEIEKKYKINGEEAIKLVYSAIDALNALNLLETFSSSSKIAEKYKEINELNNKIIPKYRKILNEIMDESTKDIVEKFHNLELNNYHGKLKKEFSINQKPFGNYIKELIDNKDNEDNKNISTYIQLTMMVLLIPC
ncbi:hypothetical protein MFS40622_0865 [Methanocaldococcus sp. FS406-22]|uniref:hypothetical protein n=1 Tax=Methanocaldococcus sp. (strain FS406-22) TaxID=644281 RepID=UPI0001BF5747|nr:hypothetical protein [Methanocaldococcus sp. FS406-22]ADC69547.1 hypothetical protein MFS40622_0865 [Methanocaldococcus sp. FS406-22]